jgi:hypothetical protein
MARREPSHPPSDPDPVRISGVALGADDRPGRAQLGGALLLGLVLVGSGLYLWRRPPHSSSESSGEDPVSAAAAPGALVGGDAGLAAGFAAVDAGSSSPVSLSEPRVLSCQDRGPKKTPPDACDRLASVEQALNTAITQSATCVAPAGGGGTIEYVADVSFSRHQVHVSLPKAGRSMHDRKVLRSCSTAVRSSLQGLGLDSIDHQHARYKIAVTATYKATAPGG